MRSARFKASSTADNSAAHTALTPDTDNGAYLWVCDDGLLRDYRYDGNLMLCAECLSMCFVFPMFPMYLYRVVSCCHVKGSRFHIDSRRAH